MLEPESATKLLSKKKKKQQKQKQKQSEQGKKGKKNLRHTTDAVQSSKDVYSAALLVDRVWLDATAGDAGANETGVGVVGDGITPDNVVVTPLSGRVATQRLVDFLKVFKLFTNWGSVSGAGVLRDIFNRLLVKPDGGVAVQALECVLSFKDPSLMPYRVHLTAFVDDRKYRHEMAMFSINRGAGVVEEAHRPVLIPTLIRLLYGRLLQRKGRSSKDTPAARRAVVLGFFAGVDTQELAALVQLVLRPFSAAASAETVAEQGGDSVVKVSSPAAVSGMVEAVRPGMMTVSRATGFLKLLGDMIRILGVHLRPWLHQLLAVVLRMLRTASASVLTAEEEATKAAALGGGESDESDGGEEEEDGDGDGDDGDGGVVVPRRDSMVLGKAVRALCLQRLGGVVDQFPKYNFGPWFTVAYVCVCVCACVTSPIVSCVLYWGIVEWRAVQ